MPGPEAVPLHVDLLEFYADGAEGMSYVQDSLGFFEVVLPMLQDVENLALPALPDNAGIPEIKAAAAEDRKTMEGYLKDLENMEPPEGLQEYSDKLMDYFRSIDEAGFSTLFSESGTTGFLRYYFSGFERADDGIDRERGSGSQPDGAGGSG